jgi:hypothetical protein
VAAAVLWPRIVVVVVVLVVVVVGVGMPARVWLAVLSPLVIKKNGNAHAHGKFGSMPAGF